MVEKQLYYVGDTPLIKIDCVNDISDGGIFEIRYRKPDGSESKWIGNLSGTRYIEYQTLLTDLDMAGTWLLQAFVDWGVIEKYGNTIRLKIHEKFMS